VASAYGYDPAGRLTGVAHSKGATALGGVAYTLDNAGNRTRETATGALAAATPVATTAYGYDPVGNRTSVTTGGAAKYAAYDDANRLCWDNGAASGACATPAGGATTYTNDNAGNRTGKTVGGATTAYAYDAANRLKAVTAGGSTAATYTYDGNGYRVGKAVGSTTTTYAWDRLGAGGLGTVVGDGQAEYVFGPAGLQQRTVGAASQYAGGDGLGSVRLVTDASGNAAGAATYEPWGAPRGGSASLGSFGYTGEQQDAETGFVYLRARNYDPASGRFVQQDSYAGAPGNPQGQNRFAYASGNPVRMVDPSGHETIGEGGNSNNARMECIALGVNPALCMQMPPDDLDLLLSETGGTIIDPTDPVDVIRNGSVVDWGICAATIFGTDGISAVAGILRGIARAGGAGLLHGFTLDMLAQSAKAPYKGTGISNAARATDKHGPRLNSAFPKVAGSTASKNAEAARIVDEILTNPGSSATVRQTKNFGEVIEVRAPDGRGIRYDANGNFIGWLEP
jgi:RHS repeat-associated protein